MPSLRPARAVSNKLRKSKEEHTKTASWTRAKWLTWARSGTESYLTLIICDKPSLRHEFANRFRVPAACLLEQCDAAGATFVGMDVEWRSHIAGSIGHLRMGIAVS